MLCLLKVLRLVIELVSNSSAKPLLKIVGIKRGLILFLGKSVVALIILLQLHDEGGLVEYKNIEA